MKISYECALIENGEMIFPVWEYDAIYRYNLRSNYLELIHGYKGEVLSTNAKYGGIYRYKNTIVLIPLWSNKVVFYDIQNENTDSVAIKSIGKEEDLFFYACIYDKYMYLFPAKYDSLVVIDLETHDIIYDYDFLLELKNNDVDGKQYYRRGGVQIGDLLYIPTTELHCITEYNLRTREYTHIRLNGLDGRIVDMCEYDGNLYLLKADGTVMVWSKNQSDIKIIMNTMHPSENSYNCMLVKDGICFLFPYYEKNIIALKLDSKEITEIRVSDENIQTFCAFSSDNDVLFYSFSMKKTLVLNVGSLKIEKEIIFDDINENVDFELKHTENDCKLYKEKDSKSLEQFLKFVEG